MQKGIKKVKWNRKKFITLSIVSLVIISVVIGAVVITKKNASKSTMATAQRTVQVTKGNIEVSITGSGTVASASTSDLMSNADGKITKSYFSEGDAVKKGDLIYEVDDTAAKLNIQKIENSISQAQLGVSSTQKNYANLTITAPFSGKVTNVSAEVGENVNNGMSLFTITETSKLTLSVPFSTTYIPNIKVGQKAEVNLETFTDTIGGVVTAIGDYTYTAPTGGMVRDVEVTVTNPGSLTDETTASVSLTTNNGIKLESTEYKFSYANKKSVQAATSGTFSSVNIKNNQYVNKGDVLIQVENDDLQITSKTNDLKMQDLNNQLTAAQKQLENYKVYSPIDGTISAVTAVVGDSVKSGSTLISIRDFKKMEFTISVDELDISKVKVGQQVSITIDALTETTKTPLSGEVIYKAMEGTSSNGVATYNVTIKVNETENLLAGMNANASIILNKAENALLLPLEAITKMGDKAFVRVVGTVDASSQVQPGNRMNRTNPNGQIPADSTASADTKASNNSNSTNNKQGNWSKAQGTASTNSRNSVAFTQNQEYYAGTIMKEVVLGLNSDEYAEIKSGLSEGDVVVLPPLVTNASSSTTQTQSNGFSLGGMGGGVAGGMPSDRAFGNNSGNSSGTKQSSTQKN